MCGLHANAHRYVRRFWRGFKAFLLNIPHLAHLPCFVPIFLPSRKMPSLRLFFPVLLLTPLTTSLNLPQPLKLNPPPIPPLNPSPLRQCPHPQRPHRPLHHRPILAPPNLRPEGLPGRAQQHVRLGGEAVRQ